MENIYRKGNVCIHAPFTISILDSNISTLRIQDAKRPWASHTKKDPNRKHQQGQATTKKERENDE